jgi:putative membrane protein
MTFAIELVGVQTGAIFGQYTYGDTLGKRFLGVPIIIGLNWVIVIMAASEAANLLKVALVPKLFIAAFLAVLLDFLIEPVAAKLGYWYWSGGIIPVQNFIAWFVLSFILAAGYYIFRISSGNRLSIHFYISQLIFFGALNFVKV